MERSWQDNAKVVPTFATFSPGLPKQRKTQLYARTGPIIIGVFSNTRHCLFFGPDIRHWGQKLVDIQHFKISLTLASLLSKGKKMCVRLILKCSMSTNFWPQCRMSGLKNRQCQVLEIPLYGPCNCFKYLDFAVSNAVSE